MHLKFDVAMAATLVVLAGCASQPNPLVSGRWVYLTHAFSSETLY